MLQFLVSVQHGICVWGGAELEEVGEGGDVESLELETAAHAGVPRREWGANPYMAVPS